MELRVADKLILALLADIIEKLEIKGTVDPGFLRAALSGHSWALDRTLSNDVLGEVPASTVQHVMGTLEMWHYIEESFARLSDAEKEAVLDAAPAFGDGVRFPGWDTTCEFDCISVADMLVQQMGDFPRYRECDFSTGSPRAGLYDRMRGPFDRAGGGLLNQEQLIAVLRAGATKY